MSGQDPILELAVPPHSQQAEQTVLGSLLLDNNAYDRVTFLRAEHFYRDDHRRIFCAIVDLVDKGKPADIVTVTDHLQARGDLDKAGGPVYLAKLASETVPFNIARHAELVRNKAILRALIANAQRVMEQAMAGAMQPREIAEEAEAAFLSVLDEGHASEMVDFSRALLEDVEWEDNPLKGVPTGFRDLDAILHGLMPGDLIIIAGRPSMGKTALAMNIAENVAKSGTVAVFSMEMKRRKIARRARRYHEAQLGSRDAAVDHLSGVRIKIDDTPAISIGHMRLRLRRLKRQQGLSLVVVDYLQLVTAKAENRTQEVSAVSRGLKAIAMELDVPVIAVAQLNRGVEGKNDRRPMMSDLRESGAIEQDADIIAFVYREEYYTPDTNWKGIAEVIVRKNRDGPIATAYLGFVPEYTRFHNREGPLPERSAAPEEHKPRRTVVSADFSGRGERD